MPSPSSGLLSASPSIPRLNPRSLARHSPYPTPSAAATASPSLDQVPVRQGREKLRDQLDMLDTKLATLSQSMTALEKTYLVRSRGRGGGGIGGE